MNVLFRSVIPLSAALLACGCDIVPPGNTGGTVSPAGTCGRGLVVVDSDYSETNVSLVRVDGKVLSSSFTSSATPAFHSNPGDATLSLSGDVVQPTMPQQGDRITTIDRGLGVLTWIDVKSGKPVGRLLIGRDLALNLQDYVEVSPNKAYVPNLDPLLNPNVGALEKGSNIVIVDPAAPAITGVIDLAPTMAGEDPRFYPRPNRAVVVGKRLYVLLSAYSITFDASADSRLVTIDTDKDTILAVTKLTGMHGCTGLGLSPSGAKIAVACSGTFHIDLSTHVQTSNIAEAGLVILSRSDEGLVEDKRWAAPLLSDGPLGFTVSFVDEDAVVFTTFGQLSTGGLPARDDTFVALDLSTGKPQAPLRSTTPFSLGEVRCFSACGACFVTAVGAHGGTLHRFDVEQGSLGARMEIDVDPEIGLPPRFLGQF